MFAACLLFVSRFIVKFCYSCAFVFVAFELCPSLLFIIVVLCMCCRLQVLRAVILFLSLMSQALEDLVRASDVFLAMWLSQRQPLRSRSVI